MPTYMPTNLTAQPGALDLPLLLDEMSGPQSGRVYQGLRDAILAGRLAPSSRLPASRALAAQFGIRRNTVVGAYEQLLSDGLAEARVGAGTFVAAHVPSGPARPARIAMADMAPGREVFALGRTGVDALFQSRLRRALGKRLRTLDPIHFGYGDPRGARELRERLAEHLAVSRGVSCDPGHIVLVSGTQQGLQLCLGAVLKPGDAAWIEGIGNQIIDSCSVIFRKSSEIRVSDALEKKRELNRDGLVVKQFRRNAGGAIESIYNRL